VVERAPPTLGLGVLEADGLPLGLQVPHGRHPVRGGPGQDLGGKRVAFEGGWRISMCHPWGRKVKKIGAGRGDGGVIKSKSRFTWGKRGGI